MADLAQVGRILADFLRNEELFRRFLLPAFGDVLILDQGVEVLPFGIRNVEIAQQDVGDIVRLLPLEQEIGHRLDFLEPPLIDAVDGILPVIDVDRTELEIEPAGAERHQEGGPGELDAVHELLFGKDDLACQAGELDLVGIVDESHGLVAAGRTFDTVRHDIGPVVAQDGQHALQTVDFLGVQLLDHHDVEVVDDFRDIVQTLLEPVLAELTDVPGREQERLRRRLLRDLGLQLLAQFQQPFDHPGPNRFVFDFLDFLVAGHRKEGDCVHHKKKEKNRSRQELRSKVSAEPWLITGNRLAHPDQAASSNLF